MTENDHPLPPNAPQLSNEAAQRMVREMIQLLNKGGWQSETDEIDAKVEAWLTDAEYPKSADRAPLPPPQARTPDWTVDPKTGRSNSSTKFNVLVGEISQLITSSAHDIICGNVDGLAGLIMAQLAHVHKLSPAGAESAPQEAGAHPDFLIMASMLCLNKGRIEGMLPGELRDFLSDIWEEMELVRRGVPLEETKNA